jgi:precorrin-6B C5,15-methyltransferase / cobalt-precorrin-6B C5,C15-methyltransferase
VTRWLSVVGLGEDGLDGLTSSARALVDSAEVLVGGARHHAMLPAHKAERLTWDIPLTRTVHEISKRRGKRVAVLATGDPMWFGIGVTLARKFTAEDMTILPQPGAFTLAAARLGWSLADTETITLHGRPLAQLALHLYPGARILALSENGATPTAVAALLRERGWGPSTLTVLEHLGGPKERRVHGLAESWSAAACADLNTIAIECRPGPNARALPRVPGLPDDCFVNDGQLTKREVRAATLAALAPLPGQLLWDVGAGCGAVAIEWMRVARGARAIAVESNEKRLAFIAANAAALGVPKLSVVPGAAPDVLPGLQAPDAAFIGGGLTTPGVVDACWASLKTGGRIVANAVTLEGEAVLTSLAATRGGTLTRIGVARAEPVGGLHGWRPLMSVTQWAAVK